jgi:hypothetical protein
MLRNLDLLAFAMFACLSFPVDVIGYQELSRAIEPGPCSRSLTPFPVWACNGSNTVCKTGQCNVAAGAKETLYQPNEMVAGALNSGSGRVVKDNVACKGTCQCGTLVNVVGVFGGYMCIQKNFPFGPYTCSFSFIFDDDCTEVTDCTVTDQNVQIDIEDTGCGTC